MRLSATKTNSINQYRGLGNQLWDLAGERPSLDLPFSDTKSLVDATTGSNLVTFTRASSGTFVGSDGLIQTAVTNLVLRSEEFDNASWSTQNVTANANTADTAAPNGLFTAGKITGSSSTSNVKRISQSVTLSAIAYTFTVYAKANDQNFLQLRTFTDFGTIFANFDISNGEVGSSSGVAAASTQAVGNGWYRCQITFTPIAATASVSLNFITGLTSSNAQSTTLTTSFYLWGAQLEQSSTVGEYIPTTSTINSAPRFDHNPTTGESLGLLVEEQRTNSIRNNTMVGASAPSTIPTNWFAFESALELAVAVQGIGTENGIAYIDIRFSGTVTAQRNGLVFFEGNIAASAAQLWAESSYIKLQSGSLANIEQINLRIDSYNSANAFLSATTSSAITPTSAALGTQRQSLIFTTPASTAFVQPGLRIRTNASGAIDITLRIGLPQLEQGAFATSVIPTSTATVTRSADVASISGSNFSSWFNAPLGSLFSEIHLPQTNTAAAWRVWEISGTNSYRLRNASGQYNTDGNSGSTLLAGTVTTGIARIGAAFSVGSNAISVNGAVAAADALSPDTTGSTTFSIGNRPGNDRAINGTIRRLTYWPQRLSNPTLQSITQ